MKKFKIKNRVKRKYVRKEVAHQTFSIAKSGVGVIPTLFIIVGLLTTYIIAIAPTDTIFNNITIPLPQITVSLPHVTLLGIPTIDYSPLNSLLTQIQTSLSTFGNGLVQVSTSITYNFLRFITNAFGLSAIWLQSTALSASIFITDASQTWLGVIGQVGVSLLSLMKDYVAYSWQVRVDFYTAVGSTFVTLYGFIIAGSSLFATTVWHIIVAKILLGMSQLIVGYQGLVLLVATLLHSWMAAVLWIKQSIAVAVYWTFLTLIMVIKNLLDFGNAVLDLLFLPFKLIGAYLAQTKPFWVAFGKLIEHAANELLLGFKNVGLVTHEISGK